MPASKKVRTLEVIGVVVFVTLFILASLKIVGFVGLPLRIIIASFTTMFALAMVAFLKPFRVLPLERHLLLKYMLVMGLLYVGLYYTIGAYTGYQISTIQFGLNTLLKFILPIGITIVSTEVIRSKLLCYNDTFSQVAAYLVGVLSEISIYMAVYDTAQLEQFLLLVGLIGASITSNLLYNFISKRFGASSIIIFRLIITLYAYIIPIRPDIYEFFTSFLRMIAPLFVYWVVDRTFLKHEQKALDKGPSLVARATATILCIIMLGFIAMVSCKFAIGAIVVGSASMTDTINAGDVAIIKSYDSGDIIEEGDIIVFEKMGERIIHRVIKISTVAGAKRYYTKGDANDHEDGYFVVANSIYGKVIGKIPSIGWPTLWLKGAFER